MTGIICSMQKIMSVPYFKVMKRSAIVILITAFLIMGNFACQRKSAKTPGGTSRLKVLTTFLPIYVFTMNVAKDVPGVSVDVLIPPEQAGPHSYEPTPSDMKKVAEADILIANGLGIETFLDRIKSVKPGLKIVFASEGIQPLPDVPEERLWETGGQEDTHHEEHGTYNPHLWVSPYLAAKEAMNISAALASLDPADADKYRANAAAYSAMLNNIANEIKNSLAGAKNNKIVTVHNAFDYFARDFGLDVVAVLRVDPESEPRAGELALISQKMRSMSVAAIFTEPQFSTKIAEVLAKETGIPVYELDPADMGRASLDLYQRVMRKNMENLKTALGAGAAK